MKRILAATLLFAMCGASLLAQSSVEELQQELATARGADRVDVLNRLAGATQSNAPQDSIAYATEALELAEQVGDREGEALALNNLGIAHYRLAEYDDALGFYERSLQRAERLGDDEAIANALNNIGVIYYMWGEHDRSVEYYSRALEMRERIGEEKGLASAHNNMGGIYYTAERYEESLRHYSEALRLYEVIEDEAFVASTLNNIGLLHHKLERFDEALESLERALEIAERVGDKATLALSLNNIGLVYDSWGQHSRSLDHYRRALVVREEIGDRQGAAICRQNIGSAYAAIGDFDRALEYMDEALEMATELGIREIQRDTHLGLAETYERMGDFERALASYRQYKDVDDSLIDEETGRRLAELQTRYEVEKKDREIEVLVKNQEIQRAVRNAILAVSALLFVIAVFLYIGYRLKARANEEMRKAHEALKVAQAAREKAARAELAHVSRVATLGELAAALAHELNQPLTAIMANAQATRRLMASEGTDPAELDDALADIADGAGNASEIIKRLRELLRRGDLTREPLDINDAIRGAEAFARTDANRHAATLTLRLGTDLPSISGDRIQLQQVLLNLVHNAGEAMKGTPRDERAIVVTTSVQDADTILVTVRDAGPPVEDRIINRMFEPFYTTKSEGLGMGLPICETIIEAHDGRLWASRNPDRGLTVQFTLPRSRTES